MSPRRFADGAKNILIVILIVAVVLSALVGELVDAAVILIIVVFCAALRHRKGTLDLHRTKWQ